MPGDHRSLIDAYLDMVARDDYARFGELLTDDCTFSLMPIGRAFIGRDDVMALTNRAGGSRIHDEKSRVSITNWFTDGEHLVVEYDHAAIVGGVRVRIDGYCWVFHIRNGQFDTIREYVNPSRAATSFVINIAMRVAPFVWRLKGQRLH